MFKDTFLSIIGKPIEGSNNPSKIDRNPLWKNNGMDANPVEANNRPRKEERQICKTKSVRWQGIKKLKPD